VYGWKAKANTMRMLSLHITKGYCDKLQTTYAFSHRQSRLVSAERPSRDVRSRLAVGGARKLRQTQPAPSRQVAALEQGLSVTLFERVGRAMALASTGLISWCMRT
jgi:hypothetical protein